MSTASRLAMFRGLCEKRRLRLERLLEENKDWSHRHDKFDAYNDAKYRIAALNEIILLLSTFEVAIED